VDIAVISGHDKMNEHASVKISSIKYPTATARVTKFNGVYRPKFSDLPAWRHR
jgi:hypothetical protein